MDGLLYIFCIVINVIYMLLISFHMWFEYDNMARNFKQTRWNEEIMAQVPFQQDFFFKKSFIKK